MFKKLFGIRRKESKAPAASASSTPSKAKAPAAAAATAPPKPKKPRSPEAICEIDPKKMSKDEIRKRLAELFRRHNQAEASLDPELREEAHVMLDAIVACREKYVDNG